MNVGHATLKRWVVKYSPMMSQLTKKKKKLGSLLGKWMKLISKSKGHGATTIGPSISTVLL